MSEQTAHEVHRTGPSMIQMGPGNGEASYVKNSFPLSTLAQVVGGPLWDGIRAASRIPQLGAAKASTLRVADLGCATGNNTLATVDTLLTSLRALWESKALPFPKDVEVFFSDLAANDFNTLFRSLTPYGEGGVAGRSYFAAGVPGSFHGRLFPADSIHAFTCFNAVHWLSQVPPEVLDKHSPAHNHNRVYIQGASATVAHAFSQQSARDLRAFLNSRATELVSGGFLALFAISNPDEHEPQRASFFHLFELFAAEFHELAVQGVIPRELVETLNFPIHFHSIAEWREAVDDVGLFDIHVLRSSGDKCLFTQQACEEYRADRRKFATDSALFWRSIFNPYMEAHLGLEVTNFVFDKLKRDVELIELADLEKYFVVGNLALALLTKR